MKDKLISEQALRIFELESKVEKFGKDRREINRLLHCAGGPLNGNSSEYSHAQKYPFFQIAELLDD